MKVKWIFFDLDDTLFNSKELALRARKNAIKAMMEAGLDADEDDAYSRLMLIIKKRGANYDRHYDELLEQYRQKDYRYIAAGVVAYHDTKRAYLHPFPEVVPTLLELGGRYKLGVISNGSGMKQWEKLVRLGLQHFFDRVVISEVVGAEKPDKAIFEEALRGAGCRAKEAVMVGDKDSDISPAKELGMATVCLNRNFRADFYIDSFNDILGIVDGLKSK